MISTYYDAGCS